MEQLGALVEQFPQLSAVSAEISAIVRSKFGKKEGKLGGGKGKDGAGKGKDGAGKGKDGVGKGKGKDRKCYECDATGHLAFECQVRKDRVAAGGPERLPKGKGTQNWYPIIQQWNGCNNGASGVHSRPVRAIQHPLRCFKVHFNCLHSAAFKIRFQMSYNHCLVDHCS